MLPFNVWAQSLWETLYMVILSTAISYLIGLPLGLTLVVTDKNGIRPMPVLNTVLGIVTNILRSIPFLILAVMITPITRAIVGKAIGTTAMVVPLTFAAAPYVARMVESSIKEVPFGVIEAAQSMGASPWQIVWKVLVPEAKPSLMVGGAISIVTILGYSAMAGFIGGGGLGTVAVNYGYNRYNFPIMLIAVIIIVVVVRLGLGGGGVVVAHPFHHGAVRVQTGQPSSRHLVFRIRKGIRGYFAVLSADGRGLGVRHLAPRLGRHLGVAADVEVSRVRVVGVVRRAACTVADACRVAPAHSLDRAAPDGDAAASALDAAADACAAEAALSGEGAVLALVVLNGLLKTRIITAALQLVVAVQFDGRIVVALHGDSGFALLGRAVIAAIPLLLAADVDLQVVEGDVHVALGGVDGDGVLIRLAGDDGVGVVLVDGLAL